MSDASRPPAPTQYHVLQDRDGKWRIDIYGEKSGRSAPFDTKAEAVRLALDEVRRTSGDRQVLVEGASLWCSWKDSGPPPEPHF